MYDEQSYLEAQARALQAGYTALDHALLAAEHPEDHPRVIDETVDRLVQSGDLDPRETQPPEDQP
jgi:hypothetical protein